MGEPAQIRLVVNADDFGLTPGVNRAVAELHAAGALTSATLMAREAAFADAVRIARQQPTLGVGCHVVLVDGMPVGNAADIASLVAPDGGLSRSMIDFALHVQARYTRSEHIQHEVAAQIARLQDAGIAVTHVDTHKHTHMLPRVARAVMLGALSRGVRRIRNPFEPAWCARLSPAPAARRIPFRLLHRLQGAFERERKQLGMETPDASLGLITTGSLNAAVLKRIVHAAPPGTYELVCHPGYHDADLASVRTSLKASRDVEREALLQVVPHLLPTRFDCISFAGLLDGDGAQPA